MLIPLHCTGVRRPVLIELSVLVYTDVYLMSSETGNMMLVHVGLKSILAYTARMAVAFANFVAFPKILATAF